MSTADTFGLTCPDVLTVKLYLGNTSNRPTLFWAVYVSAHVVHNLLINAQVSIPLHPKTFSVILRHIASKAWYLGRWASQYETHPASEISLQQ